MIEFQNSLKYVFLRIHEASSRAVAISSVPCSREYTIVDERPPPRPMPVVRKPREATMENITWWVK